MKNKYPRFFNIALGGDLSLSVLSSIAGYQQVVIGDVDCCMFDLLNASIVEHPTKECYDTGKSLTKNGLLKDSFYNWTSLPNNSFRIACFASIWVSRSSHVYNRKIDLDRAVKELGILDMTMRFKHALGFYFIVYGSEIEKTFNVFTTEASVIRLRDKSVAYRASSIINVKNTENAFDFVSRGPHTAIGKNRGYSAQLSRKHQACATCNLDRCIHFRYEKGGSCSRCKVPWYKKECKLPPM